MKSTCLKIFAGQLLIFELLRPYPAHADLFEALRSVSGTLTDTLSKITGVHIDEFKKLVQSGNVEEAVALYAKEKDYFASLKDDNRRYVDEILEQRDRSYRAELGEARASLVLAAADEREMRRWEQLKVAISQAQAVQARVDKLAAPGPLMMEGLKSLQSALNTITQTFHDAAPRALLSYGLFTEPAFPTKYPIAVRWNDLPNLAESLGTHLDKASIRQLEMFKKAYADNLIPATGLGPKLNELYVRARLRESNAKSFLAKQLLRDRLAKQGWVLANKTGSAVLLAVWPVPQSDVATYKLRLPGGLSHKTLGSDQTPASFIASGGVGSHELVVFLRHQPVRMERIESNVSQVRSQYQNGTRRIQNPEYSRAQQALSAAQDELQEVRQTVANSSATNANNTFGALAAIVGVATESAAESEVSKMQRKLQETPQLIDEPVLVPYTYTAKTLKMKQSVITEYAIYDVGAGTASTGSIERTWTKSFDVADQVRGDDPSPVASVAIKSTKAAQDWIRAPIEDSYEEIWKSVFADYQKNSLGI